MGIMAVTTAFWRLGVVPGWSLPWWLATSTLRVGVAGVGGGSGPAIAASPILASPISSASPIPSTTTSPTAPAIGGHLRLILGVESREGLVQVIVDPERRDCDLLAGLVELVCRLKYLLVSVFSKVHAAYVGPDCHGELEAPEGKCRLVTTATFKLLIFLADVVNYL